MHVATVLFSNTIGIDLRQAGQQVLVPIQYCICNIVAIAENVPTTYQ
jgi:hypothetical protein